jgi:bisphosphoglycerate-independent phosphoglycerate mutase (AlkP superfamily)
LIKWVESSIDVVDSPDFGRIGPVPFCNTGGHKPIGFALVSGPGINPGELSQGHIIDLAPTVLAMMGAPIPQHIVGKPLVQI